MFTDKLNVMLYVNDVEKSAAFWQSIGFAQVSKQEMEGTIVVEISSTPTSHVRFTLYAKEFIRKMSPEVDCDSVPSILFEVNQIDKLHERMTELNLTVGQVQDMGGIKVFNFADIDGNYFAVSGN